MVNVETPAVSTTAMLTVSLSPRTKSLDATAPTVFARNGLEALGFQLLRVKGDDGGRRATVMLPTRATVAGEEVLSKLLETTLAPGMTGSSFCGNPATSAPTVAEVPGDAEGLAGAVVAAWAVAGGWTPQLSGAARERAPVPAGVHAARASTVPAASRPSLQA